MVNRDTTVLGSFEPEVTHVFLPGCRACGGSHPLARRPPMPAATCPDCGAAQAKPGAPIVEKAVIMGHSPVALVARASFAVGRFLTNLSKRK